MNHKVAFSFADGKTSFFEVKPNELLLDAALRNGVNIPLDCREGVCGTCQGRCESGQFTQDYVDDEALSEHDLAQRKMLSCQTRVQSDASFYFDFDSSLCNAGATQLLQAVITVWSRFQPLPRYFISTLAPARSSWIFFQGNTHDCMYLEPVSGAPTLSRTGPIPLTSFNFSSDSCLME